MGQLPADRDAHGAKPANDFRCCPTVPRNASKQQAHSDGDSTYTSMPRCRGADQLGSSESKPQRG